MRIGTLLETNCIGQIVRVAVAFQVDAFRIIDSIAKANRINSDNTNDLYANRSSYLSRSERLELVAQQIAFF